MLNELKRINKHSENFNRVRKYYIEKNQTNAYYNWNRKHTRRKSTVD